MSSLRRTSRPPLSGPPVSAPTPSRRASTNAPRAGLGSARSVAAAGACGRLPTETLVSMRTIASAVTTGPTLLACRRIERNEREHGRVVADHDLEAVDAVPASVTSSVRSTVSPRRRSCRPGSARCSPRRAPRAPPRAPSRRAARRGPHTRSRRVRNEQIVLLSRPHLRTTRRRTRVRPPAKSRAW